MCLPGNLQNAPDKIVSDNIYNLLGGKVFGSFEWSLILDKPIDNPFEKIPFPWNERILSSPCPFNPDSTIGQTHIAFLQIGNYLEYLMDLIPDKIDHSQCGIFLEQFNLEMLTEMNWILMPIDTGQSLLFKSRCEQLDKVPKGYRNARFLEELHKTLICRGCLGTNSFYPAIRLRCHDRIAKHSDCHVSLLNSMSGIGLKLTEDSECALDLGMSLCRKLP